MHDGASTSRLANKGDTRGVAAKEGDVVVDPLDSEALVVEAGLRDEAGGGLYGGAREPAEGAEAIVDGDEDDAFGLVVLGGLDQTAGVAAVVGVFVACCVAAAVDPTATSVKFFYFILAQLTIVVLALLASHSYSPLATLLCQTWFSAQSHPRKDNPL